MMYKKHIQLISSQKVKKLCIKLYCVLCILYCVLYILFLHFGDLVKFYLPLCIWYVYSIVQA